jgi:TolB protein
MKMPRNHKSDRASVDTCAEPAQSQSHTCHRRREPTRRPSWILVSTTVMVVVSAAILCAAQSHDLGLFTDQGSVGQTPPGVKAQYNAEKGEYEITGGGANIWGANDAFYFLWRKASGDITLMADVRWVGTSSAEHRKAVLMIRQSLDPGAAYADAVSHGNGLTSLQFRGAANEQTYQVVTQVDGPVRLRIERKGSRFTMYAGKPNEELKEVGPIEYVGLQDPVYVGLGVCSHVANTLETAKFSNVKFEEAVATK